MTKIQFIHDGKIINTDFWSTKDIRRAKFKARKMGWTVTLMEVIAPSGDRLKFKW